MEDDKKKKRNKKKKNKQQPKAAAAAAADDTTSSNAGETSSVSAEQDDASITFIDHKPLHFSNNGSVLVDSGKQHWLQEEAKLKDMVKQLLYEKDSHLQREADLETRIEQLQSENESWHQKEMSLEQKISHLLQEKAALSSEERSLLEKFQHAEKEKLALVRKESVLVDSGKQHWLQEEAKLKDMVKQLLYEKDSHLQREADLETRIEQLQSENESWHQKEMSLEQKISHLLQEKAALSSEERSLLEKFQHAEKEKLALVRKENISKDVIETLSNENARLKMQVLELEGARDSFMQENKMLLDKISILQSRVQDLERNLPAEGSTAGAEKDGSEKDNLNAQVEEAYTLIGKLMTENAELVEKINVLHMELGQRDIVFDHTSMAIPGDAISDLVTRSAQDNQEDIILSMKSVKSFETAPIGDEQMLTDEMNAEYAHAVQRSSEITVSGEIVQIPLDENESQDLEAQESVNAGDDSVPLADAPLIGAPFRLISFFAKYVSGADLVNEGSSNSLE